MPVGPSGRTCHHDCRIAARVSTQRKATGPRSPMPKGPGRLVGWSSTPAERDRDAVVMGALVAGRGRRSTGSIRPGGKEARDEEGPPVELGGPSSWDVFTGA